MFFCCTIDEHRVYIHKEGGIIIKITIFENEFLHAEYIERAVREVEHPLVSFEVVVVQDFTSYLKSLQESAISDFDIFLIDIDLNFYFNGIEIASILRNYNQQCFIIFVTGDPSKALSSINSGTLPTDYIIKEDFHSETVKERIKNTISQIIQKQVQPMFVKEIVYLNISSNSEKMNISSINYIASIPNNRYSATLRTQTSNLIINTSLGKLKKKLATYSNFVILKSYIINLYNVASISTYEEKVFFTNGDYIILNPRTLKKIDVARKAGEPSDAS